jgi:ketosteroid isomerase-like protein
VGEHRFCHQENGKPNCAVMKFSMVWRKVGDGWKLSRVLSYAH